MGNCACSLRGTHARIQGSLSILHNDDVLQALPDSGQSHFPPLACTNSCIVYVDDYNHVLSHVPTQREPKLVLTMHRKHSPPNKLPWPILCAIPDFNRVLGYCTCYPAQPVFSARVFPVQKSIEAQRVP